MNFKIVLFIALLICISVHSSTVKVNTTTRFMIDQYSRSIIYHGVNVVYKIPPYYPNYITFNTNNSFTTQDMQNLNDWGMNVIRLYVAWEGTEPIRGSYNLTYLDVIRNITRDCVQYNISVLLDLHQDVLSRKFCGEGMPNWAVNRTSFADPQTYSFEYDQEGYPSLSDCQQNIFATYYYTYDVASAFQTLYNNTNGLTDSFVALWRQIADYMKDEPNVIGYELINEPFFGDIYNDPNLLISGVADAEWLTPLYQKTNDQIRTVDNNTIIFFESTYDPLSLGFTQGPGGPEYNDRQLFAYHVYCQDQNGDPENRLFCSLDDYNTFYRCEQLGQKLNISTFITEFGAVSDSSAGIDELIYITQSADQYLRSWIYWQYKYYYDLTTSSIPPNAESFYDSNGDLQVNKVMTLAYPYVYATCGVPLQSKFDYFSHILTYTYRAYPSCGGTWTELYLNEEYYYPNGFSTHITNCEACTLQQYKTSYYALTHSNEVKGDDYIISIMITPSNHQNIEAIIEI